MRVAMMYFDLDRYMFTFDLKFGYHHVDIHVQSQTYLGFQWYGKYYVFTVLPFGLSTACYLFTKLQRPLVRYWHSQGIKAVVYVDDGIVSALSFELAEWARKIVQDNLCNAGFVTNQAKSRWHPVQ